MINVKGKWKIKSALTMNDQFEQIWKTVEEMAADPEVDAIASGECELYAPGYMTVEKREWKEEDGKLFFKSEVEGDILGEELDPWTEIIPLQDGIEYGTFRLVRA